MSLSLVIKRKIDHKHRVGVSAGELGSALAEGHNVQAQDGCLVTRDSVAVDAKEGSAALLVVFVEAEGDDMPFGPAADVEVNPAAHCPDV